MKKDTINKILKLNNSFYKNVAEGFHTSRQYPWKGWGKAFDVVVDQLESKKEISVLDVGCGNGRFCKFLSENIKDFPVKYLGIDNNSFLLKKAHEEGILIKMSNPSFNISFQNLDVLKDLRDIKDSFDLVTAFGITHHIPGREFRKNWFKNVSKLVGENGLLVFTIWNYVKDDRSKKLVEETKDIPKEELEKGDYFLGWGDTEDIHRYFHDYSKKELENIKGILEENNLKLITSFHSDGKSSNLNEYFIFQLKNPYP